MQRICFYTYITSNKTPVSCNLRSHMLRRDAKLPNILAGKVVILHLERSLDGRSRRSNEQESAEMTAKPLGDGCYKSGVDRQQFWLLKHPSRSKNRCTLLHIRHGTPTEQRRPNVRASGSKALVLTAELRYFFCLAT